MELKILLFLIPSIHLLLSPHTKVEESFSLQATHDILTYGTPLSDSSSRLSLYDHATFPGAVKRSFVAPVLLAGLAQPLIALLGFRHAQLLVRAVLGLLNVLCLRFFASSLRGRFGAGVERWWVVLVSAQFHLMYYLTRTLGNMYAFPLTTVSAALLLRGRDLQAIGMLVIAAAVFRAEVAILLAVTGAQLLITRRVTLRQLVKEGSRALLFALGVSVPLDTYFWRTPAWPELSAFVFNALQGQSSQWGVSPWHYYFTSALPRLLLNPLAVPLVLFAVYAPGTRWQATWLILAPACFVGIYSAQPHKEARFVFYAVPPLTAAAALAANYISQRRARSLSYRLANVALHLSVLVSAVASCAMLMLSALNYPGGDALHVFYRMNPGGAVHADVLTCMTGLTLFGQNPQGLALAYRPSNLTFDKTEDPAVLSQPSFWTRFDYALMERPEDVRGGKWDILAEIHGYDGLELLKPGQAPARTAYPAHVQGWGALIPPVREFIREYTAGWWVGPRMSPRIYIMKRIP